MRSRGSLLLLLLCAACQPAARRALILDLAFSDPALLDGTAVPWREAGFTLEYRRFYPHLARSDLERYHTLLLLLGREPEAPSDAVTSGDLALLGDWVAQGGVVVIGYSGDGEGSLDRSSLNQWLAWEGTGIAVGDRPLEDSTGRTGSPDPQPWVEGRRVGDDPLGSVYGQFPLDRNHALEVRHSTSILAVAARRSYLRGPRPGQIVPAPYAPVLAASRVGDGLVIVASRYALAALGPGSRAPTLPVLQLEALGDTRSFLVALARWARRPAEWAHVPPAAGRASRVLGGPSLETELQAPPASPPGGMMVDTLPFEHDHPTKATGIPDWIRDAGVRALWAPLLIPHPGGGLPRSVASLDSIAGALDQSGLNLLAGDADAEAIADSMHHFWDERAAVRRAWRDAVNQLQPTSVAWIPASDLRRATHGAPGACLLDSLLEGNMPGATLVTLARLAAGLRQLIPAVAIELDSLPTVRIGGTSIGEEFCDAAWQRVRARMGPLPLRDSIALPDRLRALREAGLLGRYYTTLEDMVRERAQTMRDHVLRERPGLYFAFRFTRAPGDWLSLGLLRGFSLSERPLLLFTPEVLTRDLMSVYRSRGINVVHAVELSAWTARARSFAGLKRVVFGENDGFWLPGGSADTLARVLRRLTR